MTKSGAGILTLTGTNSYTGGTAINAGSIVLNNDGDVTGSAVAFGASSTGLTITGGSAVTSIWNNNAGTFGIPTGKSYSNVQVLIDGAGTAGSARLTNVNVLSWGGNQSSLTSSTLRLTNGGQMTVNGEVQIGSSYYFADSSVIGAANLTIEGGAATSTFTGNGTSTPFYIGYGDREGSNSNVVTVSSGGVLTGIGNMVLGQVNNAQGKGGAARDNRLTVTGTGTASMVSVTVGYAQAGDAQGSANNNVVEVTNGGQLTTSGGPSYIGRNTISTAGATTNSNTLTVTGTGSSWAAGNQNVFVGFTNQASAQSNNNVLTVGSGGTVTGINGLTLGSGAGTETGNELVMLGGGSLTATTISVSASNTLRFGTGGTTSALSLTGDITNNGSMVFNLSDTITQGTNFDSAFGGSGSVSQNGSGILVLNGGNSYTGATAVTQGTLEVTVNDALGTNAAGTSVTAGAALKLTGVTYSTTEALTINGSGISGGGALVNSGTSTFAGQVTAATNATIHSGGGTLNLTGGLVKDGTTLTLTGGGTINVSSAISGASANSDLVVDGTTTVLSEVNTYNGPTYIRNGGTIQMDGSGLLPSATALILDDTGAGSSTFQILSSGNSQTVASLTGASTSKVLLDNKHLTVGDSTSTAYAGTFTGGSSSELIKVGGGTLTLSGDSSVSPNEFSGTVRIHGGAISINSVEALGLRGTSRALHMQTGGTLQTTANMSFNTRRFKLETGGGQFDVATGTTMTSASGGLIEGGGSLTKIGDGTLVLAGPNTYTGATNVNAGTLIVDGDQSLATGDVTVSNANTRLMGTGTIGGATTIHAGAIHSAGSATGAVGTQTFSGSVTYNANSVFEWDLNANVDGTGTAGTDFDSVAATAVTANTDSIFKVVFGSGVNLGNAFWGGTQTWNMTALFGSGFSGAFSSVQSTANPVTQGSFTISGSALTWTAIPEPSSALLSGLLIGAGLLRRRRSA